MTVTKAEKQVKSLQMVEIDHNRFAVEIKKENVSVNLTQMAKPFGNSKRPDSWLKTKESKDYIQAVSDAKKIASTDLVKVKKGGSPGVQGTWTTDRLIAVRFAQWLSPQLSIEVDELLVKLLTGKAIINESNVKQENHYTEHHLKTRNMVVRSGVLPIEADEQHDIDYNKLINLLLQVREKERRVTVKRMLTHKAILAAIKIYDYDTRIKTASNIIGKEIGGEL